MPRFPPSACPRCLRPCSTGHVVGSSSRRGPCHASLRHAHTTSSLLLPANLIFESPARCPSHASLHGHAYITSSRLLLPHLVGISPKAPPATPPSIGTTTTHLAVSYRRIQLVHLRGGALSRFHTMTPPHRLRPSTTGTLRECISHEGAVRRLATLTRLFRL